MAHATPYLAALALSYLLLSSWMAKIHAVSTTGGGSYLYTAEDSFPVLDQGQSGHDFTKSTHPKVVEFYDPKCGACQAFRSNYVEVAKKVTATKPDVEFYGVSCEAHPSLCDAYGGPSVPRIYAFPGTGAGPQDGIDVPKGAGTVHFLSARLVKALRTKDEIASDVEQLGEAEVSSRRLEEEEWETVESGDEEEVGNDDEAPASGEEEEAAGASYDPEENDDEEGSAEMSEEEDASADRDGTEEQSENEDDAEAEEEDEDEEEEDVPKPEVRRAPPVQQASRGRPGVPPKETQRMARPPNEDARQVIRPARDGKQEAQLRGKAEKPKDMKQRQQEAELRLRDADEEEHRQENTRKQAAQKQQEAELRLRDADEEDHRQENVKKQAADLEEKHKQTDAYQNTIKHFEAIDREKGTPEGHHYQKYLDERDRKFKEEGKVMPNDRARPEKGDGDARIDARPVREVPGGRPPKPLMNAEEIQQWAEESAKQKREGAQAGGRPNPPMTLEERSQQAQQWAEERAKQRKGEAQAKLRDARNAEYQTPGSRFVGDATRMNGLNAPKGTPYEYTKNGRLHSGPVPIPGVNGPQGQGPPQRNIPLRRPEERDENRSEPPPPLRPDRGQPLPNENIRGGRPQGPMGRPVGGRPQDQGGHRVPPPPPRDSMPVGGGVNVPNPFNSDPVRAKKFEEYVARRKEMLERREKMKHPIDTLLGKGPKGADNMGSVHQKKPPMNNYKAQFRGPDMRPEAQHHRVGEKVLKKIPIVKRAFKRSKAEETMNDAALSFTRGLLMGVFKTNQPLDHRKKAALLDWFDLLRVSLPPEIGLHELIDTLKYNIDSISERRENLLAVIEKHPLPDTLWSDSCVKGKGGGGFFCGYWKLLHVMSVGFAEQAGGLSLRESHPSIRVFSAKEAGDVVREHMAHFFNCQKCSARFVAQYDDCSFERCRRLVDATDDAPPESWREFPLWIWEVHNDISRHKANSVANLHEKNGRRADARKWEKDLSVIFPSIHQCTSCVTSEGNWNLDAVYDYLENEYWTFGHAMDPKLEKLLDYNDVERQTVSHGLGAYVLITLILVLAFAAKKHQTYRTGRHKKVDTSKNAGPSSMGGFGSRGAKYRDS